MNKRLLSTLTLLALLAGVLTGLVSCGNDEEGEQGKSPSPSASHTHSFLESWSYDEQTHWRVCSVEGCSVLTQKEAHRYGTLESANRCTICGRTRTAREELELQAKRTVSSAY